MFEISDDGKATVRGVGRKRQGLAHMQSGTVADIDAVVDNCRSRSRRPRRWPASARSQVIIGIAGELVKGFTTSVSQERKKPDQQLSARELDTLIESVQKDALREAERTVTWETGLPNVDIRLVHAAVTGATIDGYTVTNPVGFHGRHVRISIFNAFAPLIHLGALQTVASMLDLDLVAIVAEPYAVARCIDDEQVQQTGALFIDVGGGTTDVALVRQGGIEGTRMFALGGRAFTKSLADRLEMPFARAEELKVDFSKGVEVERKPEIGQIIDEDVAVWQAGVELVLEEFSKSGMLPGRIYLCGGGARLPQIAGALRDPEFARHLPFARPPHSEAIQRRAGRRGRRHDRPARG